MRVVFIGNVKLSLTLLETLIYSNVDIVGVCTKKESKINADHVDLSEISETHRIPCVYSTNINSIETISWIRSLRPDVIFCVGWSELIQRELIELPSYGVIGFHPTALPSNRGRHPITWALVLGLSETGSTFFFIDEGIDSGRIISQERIAISDFDDATTLYEKITETAKMQINSIVSNLKNNKLASVPQNHSLANVWRRRKFADGQIDWRMTANSVHNLVRGLTRPYVGAHFVSQGEQVRVWRTEVFQDGEINIEPGKVLALTKNGPVIKCGGGSILLLETEPRSWQPKGDYL